MFSELLRSEGCEPKQVQSKQPNAVPTTPPTKQELSSSEKLDPTGKHSRKDLMGGDLIP